jgi:acyl carrier protein
MTDQALTFDEFRERLAEALDVSPAKLTSETRFVEDLALDSIGMLELMAALDDMQINLPEESAWEVRTVGDAYRLLGVEDAHHQS